MRNSDTRSAAPAEPRDAIPSSHSNPFRALGRGSGCKETCSPSKLIAALHESGNVQVFGVRRETGKE
jgi:hypothetical protein